MSDRVAGAGSNSGHQQAHAPTDAAATNEAGRPSCGIAAMGSTDPVVHLPDFPLAEASFSSANAPASCRAEDAPQARPATPSQKANAATAAWTEQLDSRLSRCYTAGDFVAVMKELTDPEQQRFVVDRALRCFMDLGEIDALARAVKGIPGLRTIVAQQLLKCAAHPEALRSAYARGSRVGPDIDSPELRKEFASRCAAGVLVALPQNELGAFLSSRPKDDGARFALALSGAHSSRSLSAAPELAKLHDGIAGQINRVLEALNKTPTTPTTRAIVQNLCLQILHTDLATRGSFGKPPLSSDTVANAIANLWYPDDPAQARLAAEHLKGLLADRQGARLLFEGQSFWRMKLIFEVVRSERGITAQTFANYGGDPMRHPAVRAALARTLVSMVNGVTVPTPEQAADAEDAVRRISDILQIDAGQNLISGPAPVEAKLQAWAAIARDKRITAKTFTSENPFANPLLMERIAPLYAAAGAPQEFPRNSLRNMVGLAMGLTPTLPKHVHITAEDLVALKQALAEGKGLKDLPPDLAFLLIENSLFAKNEAIDTIVAKIDNRANPKPPRVAFEFNVLFTELGPIRCPAFRVQIADLDPQTGGPKFEYFDNTGRNYPGGADQAGRMTDEERAQAVVMLVFHSVLAAKPLVALHARPAASAPPPTTPIPPTTDPLPGRAGLPRAVALPRNAQNNNLGDVNGGRAQNTPNGNATPAAGTNPAAPRDVPAQNMPRGNLGNTNVSPDACSQRYNNRPSSRSRSLPVAARVMCRQDSIQHRRRALATLLHRDRDRLRRCPPLNQHRCLPRQQIRKRRTLLLRDVPAPEIHGWARNEKGHLNIGLTWSRRSFSQSSTAEAAPTHPCADRCGQIDQICGLNYPTRLG
jgi:hypothetical protein